MRAAMDREAGDIIAALGLTPHPEGGHFREIHRSPASVGSPPGYPGPRSALTAIYFLLREGEHSAWHRLRAEEAWVHIDGAPMELVLLGDTPAHHRLSPRDGDDPLLVVPGGVVQAARALGPWSLAACLVAPGFEFEDFQIVGLEALLDAHPGQEELIRRFGPRSD